MQIRPAAEHAELQDPSADLEVKAARRKWNPSLHPRDSKGRFIETGGTVRLWGGKLARVVRALPNDRILVQDQTAPNEFNGRRHTTSAKWVSMVARPDGTAPTDNENKVQEEDEKRTVDPRRGNGVALDDDGDPDTPNDPHDVDDRGRPIGDDEGDGPEPGDDQDERDETANRRHEEGARFADTEAVRRHFAQLSHRVSVPNPLMARFLAEASNAHDLRTSRSGRLAILQDDQTRRWYLSATGTGGRMSDVGDFATPEDADRFADHLESTLISRHGEPFDFSDPDLEAWANAWHSRDGKNIVDALTAARAAFDGVRPPKRKPARDKPTRRPAPAQDPAPDAQADAVQNAPMSEPPGDQEPNSSRPTPAAPAATGEPSATVSRGALKPGDRVKVTVPRSHIEWPASTRGQEKPETVIVEGTVTPTYQPGWRSTGAPLVDVTLTAPDGTEMASGETAYVMRMPDQVTVSGNTEGFAPEEMRADRVRVGDVIAEGTFGQVVTDVRRYPGGRSFTTRHLGGTRQVDGFSVRPERMLSVVPKARRRPEDVQRDIPNRTQQHPNSTDAKRAAAGILGDWSKVNELAEQQWPDGAPEEFRALAQHMQKVTDTPKGADGYHKNAEAMRGALSALDELDADSVNRDLMEALHRLEEHLDANVDRFEADARAITENKRKREAEANAPKPDAPEANAPADQPGTPTSGEPEPYDPTYQQQTDERGRLTYYRTPQGVSRDIGGRFGVGEPVRSPGGDTYIVASGNDDGTINTRKAPLRNEGPLGRSETFPADELQSMDGFRPWRLDAREAEADGGTPSPNDPGVTLSPDEVNAPAAAARAAKAPSAMEDGEIRDEIVSLMEREMANGGDLEGVDRTRLRVLEAEEARRAGRKPPEEPKPKPKAPAEEPGGLFDVGQDEPQPMFADPNNPYDQPDDPTGTPDMFAAAEGRDTSKLRPVQARKPMDFQRGDRFVDADGRTHTVAEEPIRTPRGRIRVVTEDGREHFLAPDNELRVLHADEEAPEVPQTDASGANAPTDAPEGDGSSADVPAGETPENNTPETEAPETVAPASDATDTPSDADAPVNAEPAAAPVQVTIDHSGTGTVVRFPTPNGMVGEVEFAALRSLGFKPSRDRTKPRFFYLPSNMTLSRRADRVRQLKEWLDRQDIAHQSPEESTEKPELSEEQLQQLEGRYWAPAGTWAVTDFQPGDEVWTGRSWDTVDSIGPKNLRLQGRGSTPYDSVLARRRGGEIRTMFDEPADDGMPRPGATDPQTMRDEQIAAELEQLRSATLPEGNDPTSRTVRRQVAARIHALTTTQSERNFARRRDESGRRAMAALVRDPERLAAKKAQQVQGRDGAPIGAVYQEKKGKWLFVDRDGRTPTSERYKTRAAAITALNKLTDGRNERAGEGWKHAVWDDVQPGDTVRVPELGRQEDSGRRVVTGWSEPLEVSEIRRGDMGQVLITGRRGDEDFELEVPRTDATFGAAKPGTVPDREPSDAGDGLPWQQMTPDDFGQDERPAPTADPNTPRPTDEFGTPDLIANGTPDNPEPEGDRDTADAATAPDAPIRDTSPADMTDEDITTELEELQAWQNRHVSSAGEGPRVQGSAMLALSPVVSRRGDLHEEQRKREGARRDQERKEKEKQERAEALARAEIGKRNDDGSYPVTVDGEEAGTVRQLGRQWMFQRVNEPSGPLEHSSRAAAVAALVRSIDVRREMDEARSRDAERRTEQEARAAAAAQPVHGPAYSDELRARMADIGDDIATLQRREGLQDPERIQRLQDLIQRVSRGETDDLQGDLRQIRDEAAWLESQFDDPNLELPYETRSKRSWATAARMKAERDLRYPDFQSTGAADANAPGRAPETPSTAPELDDEFAAVRQRYDGDMVPASEVELGDWVHTVSSDPVYNEPMHMVGRVIDVTPVLSNGQRRIEVETHLTLNGKDTVRTEFAMIRATDLVERLPEGNPGREDSSDLARRIEGDLGRHRAAKIVAPEGWQAVDGSQIQPRPGDRFRIDTRRGGGSGPNGGPEHMNVTVEGPSEGRDGYWRVKGQPMAFHPRDIVAIPDDADTRHRDADEPDTDAPNRPDTDDRASRAQGLFGEGMNAVGGESLAEMQELEDRLGRADSADDRDAELRDIADRMDALAEQYELAGPQGEHAADRFRRAASVARGERDDRSSDSASDDGQAGDGDSGETPGATLDSEADEPLSVDDLVVREGAEDGAVGVIRRVYETPRGFDHSDTKTVAEVEWHWAHRRPMTSHEVRIESIRRASAQEMDVLPDLNDNNGTIRRVRLARLVDQAAGAVDASDLPEVRRLKKEIPKTVRNPARLPDISERLDSLAERYDHAGPQGENVADLFRRAARVARGDQEDRDERRSDDNGDSRSDDDRTVIGGEPTDGQNDGEDTPDREDGEQQNGQDDDHAPNDEGGQDDDENHQRRGDADPDGGGADPDGGPDGAGAPNDDGDGPDDEGNEEDAPEVDDAENENDEERRRRRRRRNRGEGGPGEGGPGLPHLRLPDFDTPNGADDGGDGGRGRAGHSGDRDGGRSRRPRHNDVDSLRNAWRTGDGLTAAEDTPERRALLASLADREGLELSPEGGLAMYPEQQADGTTAWRFAQARNGTNLPGITLTSDDPEEARALAGRFEEITDGNGDPFDWHAAWGPASIAAWRDGEGRNLPQALRAVQDDYEQERAGEFTLPEDLSDLDDTELEAAYMQGLGPDDELRVMAEMDRRDGYVDERIRAAVPETPPANADEAEREGRLMDEALGFGDTDITQPAPATPGRLRREFDALDEERYQAAMQATGGRMLSPEAEAQGIDPRAVFSGGKYSNKRAQELASPELNLWMFGDKTNVGNGRLTYPQYRARENDRALRAEFADWDEARYRQAVDFTNGYLFRREYKFGNTDFDERELFSGGSLSARDRWRQYASEELQEWFDLNGGRQTFAQYREQRRDNDRAERQQYEEEQRTAQDAGPGQQDPEELREIADDKNTRSSKGGRILVYGNQDAREGGGFNARFRIATSGSMLPIVHDDLNGFRTQKEALHAANVLEEHVRDAEGQPFPWDAPDAAQRARTFRGPDGETLADTITRVLSEHANRDGDSWQFARDRAHERAAWRQQADEWHRQQEADGYTVLADPDDLQPGDEVSHPTIAPRGMRSGPSPVSTNRATVREGDRLSYDLGGVQALGSQQHYGYPAHGTVTGPDGQSQDSREARITFGVVRRKPRPEEVPASSDDRNDQGEPAPIGGQPAHWARVEDLVPGDMVRINGTTKRGRTAQRVGYVYTAPVRVEVTRRGRAERAWRTWVTQNPDGTGAAGNIYTSINATAARAEAPDDVVPGSPASGAQTAVRSGDLPNQIPTDRDGNGLFPGNTVTGTGDREGTVTGATDTTVSVHWSDGSDDTALSPTTVTVTDGQRPDGWTADGHRVTTQNVVSDTDGALLGPVDSVDGDQVTITTADGPITRSAGDLQVTGEVRDETPDTAPVTGIDEPAAADLHNGDVVVLDLDGQLTTVAITGEPSRDGDRVTLQYADTTTGEIGEIDVDARAVLPRAQGEDGGAPDLGPDDAPEPADDLTVHPTPHTVDPVTGPTVDPDLNSSDRNLIGDHADGPDDDPDAHQAAVRITADLPVTPAQAAALATQLRAAADPSTPEGRAAMRAANRLDEVAGRTPPPGLDRPRPSNVGQLTGGDLVALPGERSGDPARIYRVIDDPVDAPGGIRSLHLEDSDGRRTHRIEHGAMPAWQLPEPVPAPVTPPDTDDTDSTADSSSTPSAPTAPVAQVRPGSLRRGDVIDAPVSRTGYQFNGHRRLTIISDPQRNGWWMQLTGVDEDGNVHDFGLHSGRAVNVYDRNRPTPALPPAGMPRDPNQVAQADVDRLVSDHGRSFAARIIDEAVAGTEPPGDIHALREQIAQRLTADALRDARQAVRRDGSAALDAAGITGRDRAAAQRRLRETRDQAHKDTVRAALRTINDLEPLEGESDEDLAARARDLLRLIPDQVAGRPSTDPDADPDVTRAVTGHADDAVNALLQQLQAAGVDPGDAERIARILTQQMAGTRQATARRIAARVAAANPDAGRQPGLIARIVALLIRMAKRLAELVREGARKIAEKYRSSRERLRRLRAFLGRMVRRVRQWPESRRLARLHRAVNLPDADGDSLAARISHWAGLMPEPGRFGQSQRRVTFWRPTTWGQLTAGRLPDRSDRIQWTPDRAADGGPGLTTLRHMAALRAAGSDVDQDVTRRLSAALGDDFGDDPHATLQHADDYVATSERRLVNLQAARSGATIPDDEDLEIEIDTARTELATARREYGDLRTRYAAAVPDAVAAALADIRDMGPEGANAIVFGPDTDPDAERAVRGVQRLIPRAWLNTPESRRLTAVDGIQGRYEPDGRRITVADLADEGMGTAGYALAEHFARHLGDLDAAQRAFWFSRTHTGRPGARRMRPSALDRLLRRQQTQPETGDSLARSVQAMFSGDWYQDDDLRAFLLGLMATR